MHVRIIQSRDVDWDLSDKIRSALEDKIAPLELDFAMIDRFYNVPDAINASADVNIALLFPRKEEAPIAAETVRELREKGAKVVFYFSDELGTYEDDVIAAILRMLGA
ncbi:MAG: hypothetical protein GXN93_04405 [Candidatus Diapherotrites archaeon]|nr:hypothetical protein [Candidatus Diapherotrites archaeon]